MATYREVTRKEARQLAFNAARKLPSTGCEVIVLREEVKMRYWYGPGSTSYHEQTTWLVNSAGTFHTRIEISVIGHG